MRSIAPIAPQSMISLAWRNWPPYFCWCETTVFTPAASHRSRMRLASASVVAIGFSKAMALAPYFSPSSTSDRRTLGCVQKQKTSGRSAASMASASA
ncbi:MAG: hypothetical protein BWZ10_03290 [candidate division BRC1 bacterium ADurb.BinA364]|nr:MAG: hypothetical protein BWZ10_03290 [candidate division BRC1 bacterium ADurb.BinA364]